MDERVNPIKITNNDTGEVYELDFSRESVQFMANNGFTVNGDIIDNIAKDGPDLWYYSFRKNHRRMSRKQTDTLYEKMGGLSPKIIQRLFELYSQALMSNNIIQDDEDLEANPHVTVEL